MYHKCLQNLEQAVISLLLSAKHFNAKDKSLLPLYQLYYILLLGFLAYLLWLLVFIVNLLQTRTTWEESLNERLSDQAGSWKELHGIAVTILTDMRRTTHKWTAPLSNLGY